jgi:Tfp pilus assembly protein PilO
MKNESLILLVVLVISGALVAADRLYVATFTGKFKALQVQQQEIGNQLATAKIVHENLNHVRDLVFENMDFAGHHDSVSAETHFYNFVTDCVNDLKLKLISVNPLPPTHNGSVTTYGFDVELEGDYFTFGELCAKFENSRRIVAISTFDLSMPGDVVAEKHLVRVKMRVNTYRISKG